MPELPFDRLRDNIRSVFFGHSRAVAALADAAGKRMGLPAADIRAVRWAAYTHDIGELAIPVSTWMRAGAARTASTTKALGILYSGKLSAR